MRARFVLLGAALFVAPFFYAPLVKASGLVQASGGKDCGTATACQISFPGSVTAGDSIAVVARVGSSSTPRATDSLLSTYSLAASQQQTADPHSLWVLCAPNVSAGADTVTVSISSAATLRITAIEFTGSCAVESWVGAQGNGSVASTVAISVVAAEFVLEAASAANPATFTVPPSFSRDGSTSKVIAASRFSGASAESDAASFGLGSSDLWAALIIAFRPRTILSPPPPPQPSAPGNLAAAVIGPAEIDLSWTASTEPGGVIGQYLVESCQGAGCSNFVQVGTSSTLTYQEAALTGSTSLSHRVRAVDANSVSGPYSAIVTVSTPAPTFTAPTGLTASAGASASQINLSWTAATEVGGTISQYLVERCQGAGCSNFAQISAPSVTNFSDTGLSAMTSYSYRDRATDAKANIGPYSNTISATTAVQTIPVNLTGSLKWCAKCDGTDDTPVTGSTIIQQPGITGTFGMNVDGSLQASFGANVSVDPMQFTFSLLDANNVQVPGATFGPFSISRVMLNNPAFKLGNLAFGTVRLENSTDPSGAPIVVLREISGFKVAP